MQNNNYPKIFVPEEENKLFEIVNNKSGHINWIEVANELNYEFHGNKDPLSCQLYYNNAIKYDNKLGEKDSIDLYWAAHKEIVDGKIRWREISKYFPNKYI